VVVTSHVKYWVPVPVDAQTEMVSFGGCMGMTQDELDFGMEIGGYGCE
jgi:hypothetical protein